MHASVAFNSAIIGNDKMEPVAKWGLRKLMGTLVDRAPSMALIGSGDTLGWSR
jgi:hypothetical protein